MYRYKINKPIREHSWQELVSLLNQDIGPENCQNVLDRLSILNKRKIENNIRTPRFEPPVLNYTYEQKLTMLVNLNKAINNEKQFFD